MMRLLDLEPEFIRWYEPAENSVTILNKYERPKMSTRMRAKVKVNGVTNYGESEDLCFNAVCANDYDANGLDENNTFAKFTPSLALGMMIANPALVGKFKVGDVFYLDFTPTEETQE